MKRMVTANCKLLRITELKTITNYSFLMDQFLEQIKKASFVDDNFSVNVSKAANEVVATYTKDETGIDLVIRLPPSYPLRPVDVECTRSLGISEVKQRKWLMSMMLFVRNQVFSFPHIPYLFVSVYL